jgi:gluconolactonase
MEYWHAPRSFDGCVQRVDPDGSVTVVTGALPGPDPHRPNDLCFAPDGSLVVTDSANWEDMRNLAPGRILRVDGGGDATQLAGLPALPNGIAFGPDGRLYVAQSLTRKILAFEWTGGPLGEPETHCRLEAGMPDGLCFAEDGTLYVCGSIGNAIHVYGPDGAPVDSIDTGEGSQPTNCCLAGGKLFATLAVAGQLVSFDVDAAPLPLHRGQITAQAAAA